MRGPFENQRHIGLRRRRSPLAADHGYHNQLCDMVRCGDVMGIPAAFVNGGLKDVVEDPFGASMCLVLVGLFFAPKLYRMNLLTIGDYYRNRYGVKVEVLCSILIILSYLGWWLHRSPRWALSLPSLGGQISVPVGMGDWHSVGADLRDHGWHVGSGLHRLYSDDRARAWPELYRVVSADLAAAPIKYLPLPASAKCSPCSPNRTSRNGCSSYPRRSP